MSDKDIEIAKFWYAVKNYSLQTIADHFNLTVEELKSFLRTE